MLQWSSALFLALCGWQTVLGDPSVDVTCACPDEPDSTGLTNGTFAQLLYEPAVTCAYPSGACVWDYSGTLQNPGQSNCEYYIVPTTYICPRDKNNDPGAFITSTIAFECTYNGPTSPNETSYCAWGPIGQPWSGSLQCADIQATPCVVWSNADGPWSPLYAYPTAR